MLYKNFIEKKQKEIKEFFKNVKIHEMQFSFNDFNEFCLEKMYINNSQTTLKLLNN